MGTNAQLLRASSASCCSERHNSWRSGSLGLPRWDAGFDVACRCDRFLLLGTLYFVFSVSCLDHVFYCWRVTVVRFPSIVMHTLSFSAVLPFHTYVVFFARFVVYDIFCVCACVALKLPASCFCFRQLRIPVRSFRVAIFFFFSWALA